MKTILFPTLLIAVIILANCSGDRAVVDNTDTDIRTVDSAGTYGPPGMEIPLDNGEYEFIPPFMIVISYLFYGDTCGPYCELTVGAILLDYYGGPYSNTGIEVIFEVNPDSLAAINHTAYTNEDGAAAAKLVYLTFHALEEVEVVASCGSIADTATIILPICQYNLGLNADPERLWVEQPGAYDTAMVACRLSDGLGNFIGGGRLIFTALVAGEICGPTSVYTDEQGWAYTLYRIGYDEIPENSNDPNILETGVRAALFGYPDAEVETRIICARL